jgi:hypothetical protein
MDKRESSSKCAGGEQKKRRTVNAEVDDEADTRDLRELEQQVADLTAKEKNMRGKTGVKLIRERRGQAKNALNQLRQRVAGRGGNL